jgi:hypothetical protein
VSETVGLLTVNEKKAYHNCEMIFSFFYKNEANGFEVDKDQKYKIYTTLREVEVLNEALNLYQKPGFKDNYLRYVNTVDGSNSFPEFVIDYIDSVELTKSLQALAHDEDSLVQLSEYCFETPPTFEDDFRINKKIETIIIGAEEKDVTDFDDLEEYLSDLREDYPSWFE